MPMQQSRFRRRLSVVLNSKSFQLATITALLLIVVGIFSPGSLNQFNFRLQFNFLMLTGVVVCGIAPLLMGGGFDFAAGAFGSASALLFGQLLVMFPYVPWPALLPIVFIFAVALGLLNALFCVKFNLVAFIATMGMSAVVNAAVNWNRNAMLLPVTNSSFYSLGNTFFFNVIPLNFFVMVVMVALYSLMLSKSKFGRNLMACGSNAQAARLAGLNPNRMKTIMYINSSVVGAIAGLMAAARIRNVGPGMWAMAGDGDPAMSALVAGMLGGAMFGNQGFLHGALFGAIMVRTVAFTLIQLGADVWVTSLLNGAVMLVSISLDMAIMRIRMRRAGVKGNAPGTNMVMPGVSRN
ncbi:MAG: ABC transporter permease [Oscillospiraceae bacterium]|nr:ABC transporter permease [Oscillospiraceae bacterium]